MAAIPSATVAYPALLGMLSTPVGQVTAGPFCSVPAVGSVVPRDCGHLYDIESPLHRLHHCSLQYFKRPGLLNTIAAMETLTSYCPILARREAQNDGLRS